MGVPIETIAIANNANHGLSDLVNTGTMDKAPWSRPWRRRWTSNVPSNLERFTGDPSQVFTAGYADDEEIRRHDRPR